MGRNTICAHFYSRRCWPAFQTVPGHQEIHPLPQHTRCGASEQHTLSINNVNVEFPAGQITLVAGKFGSGKTLLLLSLLGEVQVVDGKINYALSDVLNPFEISCLGSEAAHGGVAYVPQVSMHSILSWAQH
jgi:ABC-type branched-subunit amino acid transport system ATPase component